jgi:hypothetical protein
MCVLSVPLTVWMDYPPHQAPFRLIRYLLELKIAVCVVTSLTLCSPLPHTVQSILSELTTYLPNRLFWLRKHSDTNTGTGKCWENMLYSTMLCSTVLFGPVLSCPVTVHYILCVLVVSVCLSVSLSLGLLCSLAAPGASDSQLCVLLMSSPHSAQPEPVIVY